MKHFLYIILTLFSFYGYSTEISEQTEVSLLSCGEGSELHSFFGHSAIRFRDPSNNMDICVNWGLFEGNPLDPQFKVDFAKGLVRYKIDVESFDNFMWLYEMEQRSVYEQVLNLNYNQKQAIWNAIQENLKPANTYYKYDFFLDNCSTRARDIIIEPIEVDLAKHPDANQLTYRRIIANNFSAFPWIKFGTDIILGKRVDQHVNNTELMFLPSYMQEIFAQSKIKQNGQWEGFVLKEHTLLAIPQKKTTPASFFSPTIVMWLIFLVTAVLTYFQITVLTKFWDTLVLLGYTLLGVLIIFLWFFTEHYSMQVNLNLLWLNPIHFVFITTMLIPKLHKKMTKLYLIMAIFYMSIIIGFMLIPQEFHSAFTPLILLLAMKYFYWYKQTKVA